MKAYRIDESKGLEFGIYTLGDHIPNPHTMQRIPPKQRIDEIIELAELAEEAGIDFFSVGESHQEYFISQAHTVILGAIAQATNKMKIGSSSTIVSTSDPVRIYEDFATLDLISNGRAEIIAGRASRVGLFNLLGYSLRNYHELFEEKFELLLQINEQETINWEGEFRQALRDATILPRPLHGKLPIWRAVGGPPESAMKAGRQGVPMSLATLGGPATSFKYSIDVYREALKEAGHDPKAFPVATAGLLHVADTMEDAINEVYPHSSLGLRLVNGSEMPRRQTEQARDVRDVLNIGPADHIIEKILYQHELFGQQRYMAQIDFGGVPFKQLMKTIDALGTTIIPEVRKHLKG